MVRAVTAALLVAAAAAPASAGPRCDLGPNEGAALDVPACWDPATARTTRDAIALELATYGVDEVSMQSTDAATLTVTVAGGCAGDDTATLRVERAGRTADTHVSLTDVADPDRPRILALAVGEVVATLCAARRGVADPTASPIASVEPPPPPELEPDGDAAPPPVRPVARTIQVRLFGAGELRWFEAQASTQLGGVAGARVPVNGVELGAGIAWFGAGASDVLGDVTMSTIAGRAEARRRVLELGRAALFGRATLELGASFGSAEPDGVTVSAESERTLYVSAGAGMDLAVRLAPWLAGELSIGAAYGRGQVGAAAGRELLGTGGASVLMAVGLEVPL